MCTVVLLIRPGHVWPLILAANRDEVLDRPWHPPAAHWPDQPDVTAGRDRSGGGTWMGVNAHGVVAAVLNRPGSLGPAAGKRSRGELPLRALAHPIAADAARPWPRSMPRLAQLQSGARRSAWGAMLRPWPGPRPSGGAGPDAGPAHGHRPRSGRSGEPARRPPSRPVSGRRAADPGDWRAWRAILADRTGEAGEQINVVPRGGFGTVCSSLLAIPQAGSPVWLFATGPPDVAPFVPVPARDPGAWRPGPCAAISEAPPKRGS